MMHLTFLTFAKNHLLVQSRHTLAPNPSNSSMVPAGVAAQSQAIRDNRHQRSSQRWMDLKSPSARDVLPKSPDPWMELRTFESETLVKLPSRLSRFPLNRPTNSWSQKIWKDCWVSILLHSVIYVISCLTEWRSLVRPGSSPNREALTWRSLRRLCHFLDTFRRGSFCEDLWQYKMDEKLLVDLLTYIPVEWILVWESKMMIIENWSESNRTRRGTERRLGFLFIGGSGYYLKMVLWYTESNGLRVPHFWNPRSFIVIELHRME